jgi:hypothetical protein
MNIRIQDLASILSRAPFHFLGVTALPLDPPLAPPCSLIPEHSITCFQWALNDAVDYWNSHAKFAIVGSNALIDQQTAAQLEKVPLRYPPGFGRLESPQVLMDFDSTWNHPD